MAADVLGLSLWQVLAAVVAIAVLTVAVWVVLSGYVYGRRAGKRMGRYGR